MWRSGTHDGRPTEALTDRQANPRAAVETDELTVTYGSFTAVDRVSPEVGQGEIYGLLGPNGSGKTSVIRALTTIVPAAGSATIAGHPLCDQAGVRSVIGVLPDSNGYPGGILPVSIAAPGLVGAMLLVQLRLTRRTRSESSSAIGRGQP